MTPSLNTSLPDWLAWMESLHPSEIDLGLKRVRRVAEALSLDASKACVITVAGTNGKGSFIQVISALLSEEHARFGSYTSPHILHYNERIQLDGKPVSDALICDAFSAINIARGDISLTYFEFGTLAAMYIFQQAQVDYWLLEVGLGGRLDAVNIVDADVAVITSIGIDHELWLGNTRDAIAQEKAGILRADKPFICVDSDPPLILREIAQDLHCQTYWLGHDISFDEEHKILRIDGSSNAQSLSLDVEDAKLPLASVAAACKCYQLVSGRLDAARLQRIITGAQLPGRFERVTYRQADWVLDVAHNPAAVELLVAQIIRKYPALSNPHSNSTHSPDGDGVIVVFAAMLDKDISTIAKHLTRCTKTVVCTGIPDLPRSASASDVSATFAKVGVNTDTCPDPEGALSRAYDVWKKSSNPYPIFVVGSFYLIAEVKRIFASTSDQKRHEKLTNNE